MYSNNSIKKGIIWSSFSSLSKYVLQFGGIMILARLLSPAEYGLIGVMTIFISVADIIIDSGLCGAIIKKEKVKPIDYATLATFNLVVSVLIYLIYYILAPYVAEYYNQPQITSLLRVYSISILIFAFTIVPKTKLTKELRFKTLSLINIISGTFGLAVAIIMALSGCGPMSLIGQYLTNALVSSVLIMYYSKNKVAFSFSKNSFLEQFSFGFNTTVANILKSISTNIYNNVVGITSSIYQTGYYTQALKLTNVPVNFFCTLIDGTYFPVLSQVHDKNEFNSKIRNVNEKTLTIVVVLFVMALSFRKEIIYILLGEKWMAMDWTLIMLLCAGLFITWGELGRNIIKSSGKTFLILRYETVVFILSMGCLLFTLKKGYEAIVVTFLFMSVLKSIYINYIAGKIIDINLFQQQKQFKILLLFSILLVSVSFCISCESYMLSLIVRGGVSIIIYSIYIYMFRRSVLNHFKQYIFNVFSK